MGASLMILVGSFLPWLYVATGGISGARGAGLWTFYAAMLGIAGALIPSRTVGAIQGGLMALVALALPVWQVVHVLSVVGLGGWLPGPGLVLVFGGGVLAAVATRQLWSARAAASSQS